MGREASGFPQSHCMFLPAWFSHLNLREGWAWRWETLAWSLAAPSPSRSPPHPRHLSSLGPLAWKESLVSPLWKGWFRGHSESPAGLERLFQGAGSISSSQFLVGWRPSPGLLAHAQALGTGRLRAERAFVLVLLSLLPATPAQRNRALGASI